MKQKCRARAAVERADRRRRIADFYLRGKNQPAIAQALGCTQQHVSKELKAIRQEWTERAMVDFNTAIAEQVAKLDQLEREYWEAWEKSKAPLITTTANQSAPDRGNRQVSQTRASREGDPRYLEGVADCIEKRCKLLNLYSPTTVVGSMTILNGLPDAHVERVLAEHYATPGT